MAAENANIYLTCVWLVVDWGSDIKAIAMRIWDIIPFGQIIPGRTIYGW